MYLPPSISITQLSKSYKEVKALNNISLSINKGELFGFIGPDGAGKTTLFRIMTTLLLPDTGTVTVEGFDTVKDYKQIRNIVGYMPGKFSLYQDLSVEENLKFFASIFNTTIEENYHLIKDIYQQIEPFKDRPAGKLSGGMKQKLALSCALVHKPQVLFLDEPTFGVDAVSRKEFWDMLARLRKENITILVSTPYMDEASRCDRVALMQDGNILDINTPEGIVQAYKHSLLAVKSHKMYQLLFDVQQFQGTLSAYRSGEYIHAMVSDENMRDILRNYVSEMGHQHVEVKEIVPDVEDCFMALMQAPGSKVPEFQSSRNNNLLTTL